MRHRYRAYPTPGQQDALARTFGCVRVVFNDAIAARKNAHARGEAFISASALQSQVVAQAKRTPQRQWLTQVSSTPLEQAVRDADRAYRNFFDSLTGKRKGAKMGLPRFRSRHDTRQAANFTRSARFKVRTTTHGVGHVYLPKVGWVRFALSRDLPSDPSSVTVIREADGHYYVSFVVQRDVEPQAPTHPGRGAGIDVGLSGFAAITYTDGTRETIENPRHLRTRQRRLARAQRALARKQRGSANRAKARTRVAVEHRKVKDARQDFHHQLSARLIRENQTVAVEKLNVVGLARAGAKNAQGRGLRRSVHDAGWAAFLTHLAAKGTEHQRTITTINPAYTSQTCAVCGVLDGPKPLHVRAWQCTGCGQHLDRDYNAAVNVMVAAGLAETLNARGGDVRRRLAAATPAETGTHRHDQTLAA
ncbi:RNA-guided endonuclease InsQ/TnpB family protein [Paraoerskovia marina]|nr:RNA-guided endonuclease TnpB family protein [Paraoerskovia marina]